VDAKVRKKYKEIIKAIKLNKYWESTCGNKYKASAFIIFKRV